VLEAQDFQLQRLYQDLLLQTCPANQRGLIEEYWNEVALEIVSALGYVNPDVREWQDSRLVKQAIVPPPSYRSVLLDDLNGRAHFRKPPYLRHSLIECIYIHQIEDNPAILRDRSTKYTAWQAEESQRHAQALPAWNGLKKDAIPVVEAMAVPLGFKRKGRKFQYEHSTGLIQEISFDLGGHREAIDVDFVKAGIYHRDDQELRFDDFHYHLERMVPGMVLYRYSTVVQYKVLGMRARIAALLAFANTIG